jgi:curved DNA-binding protein CbpA
VLGVGPDVSDAELRRVYRGLVQRHHPDHNGGSPDSAARFAQIQNAYAAIALRRRGARAGGASTPAGDPDIEDRLANLEREMEAVREAERLRAAEQARRVREQAARAEQASRAQASHRLRATPEELGYYSTDDSFTKIIDDAAEQLGERLRRSDAKKQFTRRLSDLFGREK